jgi:hypothetical protein
MCGKYRGTSVLAKFLNFPKSYLLILFCYYLVVSMLDLCFFSLKIQQEIYVKEKYE